MLRAKSRQLVVLTWLVVGFFISMSYKSVLLANMVNNEYEKTIDNLEDMIMSKLPAVVPLDNALKPKLETDPREKVQKSSLCTRCSISMKIDRRLIYNVYQHNIVRHTNRMRGRLTIKAQSEDLFRDLPIQ